MIPTDTTETAESWVCRSCASTNAGWRIRCEGCGVIVGASSAVWGPPSPQHLPAPVATPKTGAARTALLVVGCIAIAVLVLGMAILGIAAVQYATDRREAEQRVDDYVNGEVEAEFFAADSQFRATFPALPERSAQQTDVSGIALIITSYMTDFRRQAFGVSTFDVPPDSLFDLNLAVNGAATGMDGRIESAVPTTWQAFDAIEAVVSASDGATIQMLVVRTPLRVYMLQVVSYDGPSDGYESFKASFEITL